MKQIYIVLEENVRATYEEPMMWDSLQNVYQFPYTTQSSQHLYAFDERELALEFMNERTANSKKQIQTLLQEGKHQDAYLSIQDDVKTPKPSFKVVHNFTNPSEGFHENLFSLKPVLLNEAAELLTSGNQLHHPHDLVESSEGILDKYFEQETLMFD